MNPHRLIRCDPCGPSETEKAGRRKGLKPKWTPSGMGQYRRNFVRLPNGMEVCAGCAARLTALRQRADEAKSPKMPRVRKLPRAA